MEAEIKIYDPLCDYQKLLKVILSEGEEWNLYTHEPGKSRYQKALAASITYVAVIDGKICGYSRSIPDAGLYIWVVDLLVSREYRNRGLGRLLIECLRPIYPDEEIYIFSDADMYYQKLGYTREGSIYKVS